MYDRAPRILTRPSANTTPSVGPGTYYPVIRPHSGEFICCPFPVVIIIWAYLIQSHTAQIVVLQDGYSILSRIMVAGMTCELIQPLHAVHARVRVLSPGPFLSKASFRFCGASVWCT